jgi:hypothetical protein
VVEPGAATEPENEPVNDAAVTDVVTLRELRAASDPDKINFFQLGIYKIYYGWLQQMCVVHFLYFKRPIISIINIMKIPYC